MKKKRKTRKRINYLNNVLSRKELQVLNAETFLRLVSAPKITEVINFLRDKENSYFKRYVKKRELPAIYWQMLTASTGNTKMEGIQSPICVLDIDHMVDNPRDYYHKYLKDRVEELNILFVQVSPSGDGLHIGFKRNPEIKTIAGHHFWMAQQIGTNNWDRACTDLKRCSFVTNMEDWIYLSEDLFNIINNVGSKEPRETKNYDRKK